MNNQTTEYPDFNGEWTLFLDRDGVINKKLDDTYVMTPDELIILPGVPEALAKFSTIFGRIVIVTNQQGVGKELMTHQDLTDIHNKMIDEITSCGGRIDEIYYCPDLAYEDSPNRKPNPGMALQAKMDFPEIDFRKSIMIGDSDGDMEFAKRVKMMTIRIRPHNDPDADYTHSSLSDFSLYLNL